MTMLAKRPGRVWDGWEGQDSCCLDSATWSLPVPQAPLENGLSILAFPFSGGGGAAGERRGGPAFQGKRREWSLCLYLCMTVTSGRVDTECFTRIACGVASVISPETQARDLTSSLCLGHLVFKAGRCFHPTGFL